MEWNEIKQSGDIFEVKRYLDSHLGSENVEEAKAVYYDLRKKLLAEMKANPTRFQKEMVKCCVMDGIFTKEDLISERLATYKTLDVIFEGGPPVLLEHPSCFESKKGCADVYFLGIPRAGTTSLLMGLVNAEGLGYVFNHLEYGGRYADDLKRLAIKGVPPSATSAYYGTIINGAIEEKRKKLRAFHIVNFVEMSGDEFVHRIVGGETSPRVAGIRGGSKELLSNSNKKVLFILIDPTVENIEIAHYQDVLNADGEVVGIQSEKVHVYQRACLGRFLDWLNAESNKDLMKKVDAIHFLVTKADMLGESEEERNKKACELLWDMYPELVQKLILLCKKAGINRTTGGKPRIFTFSLGKFYLGNLFEYDSKDSLYLIDALRHMTYGIKEPTLMNRVLKSLAVVRPKHCDYGLEVNLE